MGACSVGATCLIVRASGSPYRKEFDAGGQEFSKIIEIFKPGELTRSIYAVIIVGFAPKSGDFCPAEAVRVVRAVDDGPKTDWLNGCLD